MKSKVQEIIDNNIVINLSSLEITDHAYLYLAKGLNFVPSKNTNPHSLKFDTQNFIRKLEWKAYFKQNPDLVNNDVNIHKDLFVESSKHPDYQHNCIEDIKIKLFGWIANQKFENPKSNLTAAEHQGRKWLMEQIANKQLFVSKADKGGAILILDYNTVIEEIEKELCDINKYSPLTEKADTHCNKVTAQIRKKIIELNKRDIISDKDKTLITGLNTKNKMKHAPEYRTEIPYIYPLFKIHKLDQEQINNKITPPSRMVNATKHGPLYRVEKWISPYLTKASQKYCRSEYILDTPNLTQIIDEYNEQELTNDNDINLFTIDVEKLYPSIRPKLVMEAVKVMLETDDILDSNQKTMIETFVEFILKESFVTYKDKCFKPKIGIPTGGCNSRQLADIFLQWLLFKKTNTMDSVQIKFWKRFIDDGIGLWKGTKKEFYKFLESLNKETQKLGINFPVKEAQFGKSVNFLDINLYFDNDNKIHYRLYTKPTDSRSYLKPNSFHPKHVFQSIPFSQMIRIIKRNTKEETCNEDLNKLKDDLINSGYDSNSLENIQRKAFEKTSLIHNTQTPSNNNTIMFTMDYFADCNGFKEVLKSIEEDLNPLFDNLKIKVAYRRSSTIGNLVVKNKNLCIQNKVTGSQKCGNKRCKTCPLMLPTDSIVINNKELHITNGLNCKSKNIVYLCMCKKCDSNNAYFGQTVQEHHNRMTGHREKFNVNNYMKSALSMHAYDSHDGDLSLQDFNIAAISKVPPRRLKREEYIFIDKFETKTKGLNRYQVA